MVAPRASLLWKPVPAFTYSSVPCQGPKIAPNFGLTSPSRTVARIERVVRCDGELIHVGAQSKRRAKRARPFDLALRIHAGHRLADLVLARRREALAAGSPIQAHRVQPVAPQLDADGTLRMSLEEVTQTPVRHAAAGGDPPLGLLELIAVLRVVEEVGEVGKQIQAVVKEEAGCSER